MYQYVTLLFLLISIAGNAQRPDGQPSGPVAAGTIQGILIDSITGDPVEYAAVGIINVQEGKVVDGGITNRTGQFQITNLPFGRYEVQISFIGYRNFQIRSITLSTQQPHYDCGTIILSPESQLLEEIRVSGEAALIEARPDKIIYNAEQDVTSSGGDASDVLRKVPLLTVDFDGNITMRGSENVQILINGRPSAMFNNNPADALKMMPADQIQSIEVITSPSARFDGEGTAGIINIVTRKKNIEGVAGSVDVTVGTRSNRANGNLNYGKGKIGITFSAGGHQSLPQEGGSSFRREESLSSIPTLLEQNGSNVSSRLGFRTHLGIEYNVNPANTINTSFSYRRYSNENVSDMVSEYWSEGILIDSYGRIVDGNSSRSGWDWEMDYKHNFPKADKEWSIAFELDKDDDESNFEYNQEYLYPPGLELIRESNINLGDNSEFTLQTDYVHPFSSQLKLETGLKGTLRRIVSDFDFNTFDPDLNLWVTDPDQTDIFYYDQNVYAAYASTAIEIGEKITLITGVRTEVTDLKGEFEEFNNPFSNDYLNVLPNLTIAKKTGEFNQLKLSYQQRIQRPNQRHINPFIEYSDNRDISYGNPSLTPELVHQVEIGSTLFIKGNMITASLFGRKTEDLIENLLTISDEGISQSTYYNFGERRAIGINVFGSLNMGESLSLRGGFDVNAWEVDGDFEGQFLTNSGYDYNGRINITWALSETLKVEGFTFFRSPAFTVQGKRPSWSMMSLGVKQELFKRRLTIGLHIHEPFRENLDFVRELEGPGFYQYSISTRPVRSFGINVGYRFGKLDFKERNGRRRVNNNDLKDEEQSPGDQPFQG